MKPTHAEPTELWSARIPAAQAQALRTWASKFRHLDASKPTSVLRAFLNDYLPAAADDGPLEESSADQAAAEVKRRKLKR
jgi:hypothetical protein